MSDQDSPVPEFSGPWAPAFTSAYREASSDFERKALSDGTVSGEELAEVELGFITCLEAVGLTSDGFNPDGSVGFAFPPDMGSHKANALSDRCSASSGFDTVGSLYFATHRNPQNLDDAKIIAACLVQKKVVPPSYGASDYNRDAPDRAFPFSDSGVGTKALTTCTTDPLGLLKQ
ncbi:MAG TPA: hypothetical protein VGI08_04620 [Diaminobutyricibacter sp.]